MVERSEVPWENEEAETFGAQLQRLAAGLGEVYRRLYARGDLERAEQLALLDGVVEPLAFEVGRALDDDHVEPASGPWRRAQGLLRLSAARGEEALEEEFALLGAIFDRLAFRFNAVPEARAAMRGYLDAAQKLAQAELRHLTQGEPLPADRFGGVVLEIFERPQLH